ncbi:MAG TPA: hypothetical protein VFF48_10280 [Brevundimonas sp.]|nr:hypothetical protein [Brevundimonas sp.]
MSRLHTLIGAALIALTASAAAASDAEMSFAIHDVSVTSNLPALNISVRNLSASRLPAQRNLRVTSAKPVVSVAGQVWCKSFNAAHTRAASARVLFGNAHIASTPDGADVYPIGTWSPSPMVNLGADETLRNYSINAAVDFPDHWAGGVSLGFNPVKVVEERMQQFVENGAGSQADFLRVDDVFETTITLNAVGWCEYESQNIEGRYAGVRRIEVPVHIFYHGDPDIEDTTAVVGSAGVIQGPPPAPGPSYTRGPGRRGSPPARRQEPAGTAGADARQPSEDETAALLVPAIQRLREPVSRGSAAGGVFVAAGDVNGDGAAERQAPRRDTRARRPEASATSDDQEAGLGEVVLREGARAVAGWLLSSRRAPERSSGRAGNIGATRSRTTGR